MSIYTQQELIDKIKALDVDIATAQSIFEYELDTGQGDQRARRQKLSELLKLRDYWEDQLNRLQNSKSGLLYGKFKR